MDRWRCKPAAAHWAGSVKPGCGVAAGIDAGRVEGGVDDAEVVVLAEERLLIDRADLDVVDPLHVGEIGVHAGVGEGAVLGDGLVLQIRGPGRRADCRWGSSCRRPCGRKAPKLKTELVPMMRV